MKIKIEVPDTIRCATMTYVYEDNGSLKMETKVFDTDTIDEYILRMEKNSE